MERGLAEEERGRDRGASIRLTMATLELTEFTVRELAEVANANYDTTRDFVGQRRSEGILVTVDAAVRGEQSRAAAVTGRPPLRYRISAERREKVEAGMQQLRSSLGFFDWRPAEAGVRAREDLVGPLAMLECAVEALKGQHNLSATEYAARKSEIEILTRAAERDAAALAEQSSDPARIMRFGQRLGAATTEYRILTDKPLARGEPELCTYGLLAAYGAADSTLGKAEAALEKCETSAKLLGGLNEANLSSPSLLSEKPTAVAKDNAQQDLVLSSTSPVTRLPTKPSRHVTERSETTFTIANESSRLATVIVADWSPKLSLHRRWGFWKVVSSWLAAAEIWSANVWIHLVRRKPEIRNLSEERMTKNQPLSSAGMTSAKLLGSLNQATYLRARRLLSGVPIAFSFTKDETWMFQQELVLSSASPANYVTNKNLSPTLVNY